MSVKNRMEDMLSTIKESDRNGIEMKELIKIFYEKWGFRLVTVKGYISDLEELEKVRIIGSKVYHFEYQPPRGLVRSTI